MDLLNLFIKDLGKYREKYQRVYILNKLAIYSLVLLIPLGGLSSWSNVINGLALGIYLGLQVFKPDKYLHELKNRIDDVFKVVVKLGRANVGSEQYDDICIDIVEKGLLVGVGGVDTMRIMREVKKRPGLSNFDVSDLQLSEEAEKI